MFFLPKDTKVESASLKGEKHWTRQNRAGFDKLFHRLSGMQSSRSQNHTWKEYKRDRLLKETHRLNITVTS